MAVHGIRPYRFLCGVCGRYLTKLKKHLETTREFAEQHAQKAQEQYAKYYNAHACNKSFQVGEEVIVRLCHEIPFIVRCRLNL